MVDESQALAAEMNDEEDRESFWKPVSHSASEEKEIPALVKRADQKPKPEPVQTVNPMASSFSQPQETVADY